MKRARAPFEINFRIDTEAKQLGRNRYVGTNPGTLYVARDGYMDLAPLKEAFAKYDATDMVR